MSVGLFKSIHRELQPDIRGLQGDGKKPCSVCGTPSFYILPDNVDIVYCSDHAAELQLVINRLRGHE